MKKVRDMGHKVSSILVVLVLVISCSKRQTINASGADDKASGVEEKSSGANGPPTITDEDILEMLERYADQLCACSTEACARKVLDAASSDPISIAVGAEDPTVLKARLGERMTPLEKRWDACFRRLLVDPAAPR